MTAEELPRAKEAMSRDLFALLMQLTSEQRWLVRRSQELYDVVAVCDDEKQKKLIVDLISRFHFRSAQEYLEDRRNIAIKISQDWGCIPTNTMLIALQDNACADSSSAAVQQFKGPLAEYADWKTHNFISSLSEVVQRAKDGSNIIIVDDFCGSGETISKKVLWLREKLQEAGKSVSLRVAVASSMEQSKGVICPLVEDFYSVHWLKKGIRDFYSGQDAVDAVELMEAIESKLGDRYGSKKLKDYKFGWKQSEALCYLEGENPPNNNFPIFWWRKAKPNSDRTTLLPRV
ncbi:phosphoribosyltransferase [Sulfitobacter sp.]|uniref:phosphoribosyltransferase n=1 Tax=Sulfitobacter sp. TaxID=1903071 RepID=UPI0032995411